MSIPIMPTRMEALTEVFAGYASTGVPLVALRDGALAPAGFADDLGLYLFVPIVGRIFGLDVLAAADLFLYGLLALGAAVGALGLALACRTMLSRAAAVGAAVLVALAAAWVGDVYVAPAASTLAVVPWVVLLLRRGSFAALAAVLLAAGFLLGWAHAIRSHAGTAVVIAVVLAIVLWRGWPAGRKLVLVGSLACGLLASTFWFRALVADRDAYLASRTPGYVAPEPRHPFWHSVYIGLGFTDNEFVREYRDEVAIARVAELAPDADYLSPVYESTLRAEVLAILTRHPIFAVQNLSAKLGVLLFYVALFGNVGLVAAVTSPPPRPLAVGLVAGLAFSSLFGLLVVPLLPYLTGLAAFSALLGAFSLDEALARRAARARVAPSPALAGGR